MDEANVQRIDSALTALHAHPFLAGERGTAYHTDHGQLEVCAGPTEWAITRRGHGASQVEFAPELSVLVGSASHLLLSKEQAGQRPAKCQSLF